MKLHRTQFTIQPRTRGMIEITSKLNEFIEQTDVQQGLCQIFLAHTSASLILSENADPDVQTDIETFISALVIDDDIRFVHKSEGPDDMSAHIRTLLTKNDLTVPFDGKKLLLGHWQGVFLWEHRLNAPERNIIVTLIGE